MKIQDFPNLVRILEAGERLPEIYDFEKLMKPLDHQTNALSGTSDSTITAKLIYQFARNSYHLYLVSGYKIAEIARGMNGALESKNSIVFFNLCRALVENSAAVAYHLNKLSQAFDDFSKSSDVHAFKAILEKHDATTKNIYYNEKATVHVNDMIKSLSKYIVDAAAEYAVLCEYVHPNYGSNKLVSSGTLGKGQIRSHALEMNPTFDKTKNLIEHCAQLVVENFPRELTLILSRMDSWIKIASKSGTKFSQIFSVRDAFSGDGKAKSTALDFHKARTKVEAMESFYGYIEKNRLVILKKELGALEGGYLYDRFMTKNGELWVRFKVQ